MRYTEVETEAQGVSAGARGSNLASRDSKASPVEPSRTAMALIQWFPNACDGEPFLAESLLVLGAEAHSLGTQSSCPGDALVCALLPVCGG